MTLPHHRHLTLRGWLWLSVLVFWVGVALLVARCT